MDVLQGWSRVDAELVGQPLPSAGVGSERLGGAAGAGESRHLLTDEPLPQRHRGHELLELGHDVGGPAERQVRVDPVAHRLDAALREPGRQPDRVLRIAGVDERWSGPQGQRLAERGGGALGVPARESGATVCGQPAERRDVHVAPDEPVPRGRLLDGFGGSESAAEPRDEGLQRVGDLGGCVVVVPDGIDELRHGDRVRRVHRKTHEQPPDARPGHRQDPGAVVHLHGAEHRDLHDSSLPDRNPQGRPLAARAGRAAAPWHAVGTSTRSARRAATAATGCRRRCSRRPGGRKGAAGPLPPATSSPARPTASCR